HHWGRQLEAAGHRVILLPPHAVRPYRQGNKTDRSDARALLEAVRNSDIRPVPVKSVGQQALMALPRLRSGWLGRPTARITKARGILREFGVMIPVGVQHVVPRLQALIEDTNSPLPRPLRGALSLVREEIVQLGQRIRDVEQHLKALARELPPVARLQT